MCLKNRLVFSGMREETNLWCSRILWDFNSLTSSTRQIKSPRSLLWYKTQNLLRGNGRDQGFTKDLFLIAWYGGESRTRSKRSTSS